MVTKSNEPVSGNQQEEVMSTLTPEEQSLLNPILQHLSALDATSAFEASKRFYEAYTSLSAEIVETKLMLEGKELHALLSSSQSSNTTFVVSTSDKFIAKNSFVVDVSSDALVKISRLGNNFTNWFLKGEGKIEEPSSTISLCCFYLEKPLLDDAIFKKLGSKVQAVVGLSDVFALMMKQPNGQDGGPLTNIYSNIFYVHDQNGVLRAVCVRWVCCGWSIGAYSVEASLEWYARDQVLFHNS